MKSCFFLRFWVPPPKLVPGTNIALLHSGKFWVPPPKLVPGTNIASLHSGKFWVPPPKLVLGNSVAFLHLVYHPLIIKCPKENSQQLSTKFKYQSTNSRDGWNLPNLTWGTGAIVSTMHPCTNLGLMRMEFYLYWITNKPWKKYQKTLWGLIFGRPISVTLEAMGKKKWNSGLDMFPRNYCKWNNIDTSLG